MENGISPENVPLAERFETIDEIRGILVTDRTRSDDEPLRLIESGKLSERGLADILGKSRIPIREALTILRTLGVIRFRPEIRKYEVVLVGDAAGLSDNGLKQSVHHEISVNGRAALSQFVEEEPSAKERSKRLEPLKQRLHEAERLSESNLVRDRGEAVILITDTFAELGAVAGLYRAAGVIRAGLDIIEISTRIIEAKDNRLQEFGRPTIKERIEQCSKVLCSLEASSNSEEDIINYAEDAFDHYLEDRLKALQAVPPIARAVRRKAMAAALG
jgi:hypothetical protein